MCRVRKTPPTTYDANYRWRFRYGLGREIFQDTLRSASAVVDSTEWVYLAGEAVGAVREVTGSTAALYRIHADRQGAPRKASTTSGTVARTVAMSVGGAGGTVNVRVAGPRMGRRFAGQYWNEESNILNNGYRSLFNGRFTSPDPLHIPGLVEPIPVEELVVDDNGEPIAAEASTFVDDDAVALERVDAGQAIAVCDPFFDLDE